MEFLDKDLIDYELESNEYLLDEMDKILQKKGKVKKIPFEHNIYNRYVGIASKKREKKKEKINEFIWLVDCREN